MVSLARAYRPFTRQDAGDARQVAGDFEVVPVGGEVGDGFGLSETEFESQEAAGFEDSPGFWDQTLVDVETRCAREQGEWRLPVADFALQGVAIGEGDVGRVGDDYVLGCVRYGREEIGGQEVNTG